MKEFILTVQKLRTAQEAYYEEQSDKNYFKVLDLEAIVDFMADHLLKQVERDEKSFPDVISLN